MKILILGGYGVFGGRLAELLLDIPDMEILITGRSVDKATAFCKLHFERAVAKLTPLGLDRTEISSALATHQPDLVVDATGPFQLYNGDPYKVIRACIVAETDYMDFADGAEFVFGVSQFDEQAKRAGIYILSGVSSFPVLTAAVLRKLGEGMVIHHVKGGIAPSPYAGIGLNVMRAVLSYAGKPVTLYRDGGKVQVPGLCEVIHRTISVPGMLPLFNKRFSLVDVPDLQVIPPEYPELKSIWIGAGPVPELLHVALNGVSRISAVLKLPSLEPAARFFHFVLNLMKFGEHRGGMFVEVEGTENGKRLTRSWHLLAEGDDGPYIPSMSIETIIRRQLVGMKPEPGARSAVNALELDAFEAIFANKTIYTGFRFEKGEVSPLYERILGNSFAGLPQALKRFHRPGKKVSFSGVAKVRRGKGLLANIIAAVIGFPITQDQTPVTVTVTPEMNGENWQRDFGGRKFSSFQAEGKEREAHLVTEKFGWITVALALVVKDDQLLLVPRHWRIGRFPLPGFLLPRGNTFEAEVDGKFQFDVTIEAPVVGLIVHYQGSLTPDE